MSPGSFRPLTTQLLRSPRVIPSLRPASSLLLAPCAPTPTRYYITSGFPAPRRHRSSTPSTAAAASRRTMASAPPKKPTEWLVVVPDKPGAHEKRLEVRAKHLEGAKAHEASGVFKMGGAVLDEKPQDSNPQNFKFYGSTIIVVAETKEEVLELLNKDIYVTSGVWDMDKIQIWPVLLAFRNP